MMDARCLVGLLSFFGFKVELLSAAVNALSIPPEEYGRKAKTQMNWRGPAQAEERVV